MENAEQSQVELITIDAAGDTKLRVCCDDDVVTGRFLVSSQALALACKPWQAMQTFPTIHNEKD